MIPIVTSSPSAWKPSVENGIWYSAAHPSSSREVTTCQWAFQSALKGITSPVKSPSFESERSWRTPAGVVPNQRPVS